METVKPIVVSRRSSVEERQLALTQIYWQVLERQPYGYEHKALAKLEKDFLKDKIGVRRFLKELGQSSVYLDAFYYKLSNPKFLERCFKHFMGRSLANKDEMEYYCNILMTKGVGKLVAEILDSEEYRKAYGCFTVPYPREQRCYDSPKAYLESEILRHEYFGQRGFSVATMHWHELGLDCDAGVCRHPEADEDLADAIVGSETLDEELQKLFKKFEPGQTRELLSALSPRQREALRRAIS